jgi:hypothetical protein
MTQRHLAMRRSRTKPNSSNRPAPVQLLGIGLDDATAGLADRAQHSGKSCPRHALASMSAVGEHATDPPVG